VREAEGARGLTPAPAPLPFGTARDALAWAVAALRDGASESPRLEAEVCYATCSAGIARNSSPG
jgi:hypothetical protein